MKRWVVILHTDDGTRAGRSDALAFEDRVDAIELAALAMTIGRAMCMDSMERDVLSVEIVDSERVRNLISATIGDRKHKLRIVR